MRVKDELTYYLLTYSLTHLLTVSFDWVGGWGVDSPVSGKRVNFRQTCQADQEVMV